MKAVVIDKKHLTLVSHTNGVVIVEESGCIIDLDFHVLSSIFELADFNTTCTIRDCDEIESLKSNNSELTECNKFLEEQLNNSADRITELRNQINGLNNELDIRGRRISQLNDEIETLRAELIKNEEERISLVDRIDNLNKQLEEKTSRLAERTHVSRVFRQALYDLRLYVQPYKEYELDFEWLTIRNSIDSGFFIRFKDTASAARAIGDCRYYISLKDVLDKYENDIVDFNVSAMDIYYIHKASPNVVRKFNYDNFNITCKDQRTANTINTLLNCSNISVYDIMDKFKDDITYSNTH
jgi:hypothetical protein